MMITFKHIKKETGHPGKLSLWIIWSAGMICMLVLWVFFNQPAYAVAGPGRWLNLKDKINELESIDELLVSSDEIKQAGQKTFVNVALRFEWSNLTPAINEDKGRKQIYNDILNRKLQHIERAATTDFSIRPVPK